MNPEFEHEQPADDGGELSRRGFLRLAGYSAAALSLVGCRERPPQTALPYTVKPVDVTPGLRYGSCHVILLSRWSSFLRQWS